MVPVEGAAAMRAETPALALAWLADVREKAVATRGLERARDEAREAAAGAESAWEAGVRERLEGLAQAGLHGAAASEESADGWLARAEEWTQLQAAVDKLQAQAAQQAKRPWAQLVAQVGDRTQEQIGHEEAAVDDALGLKRTELEIAEGARVEAEQRVARLTGGTSLTEVQRQYEDVLQRLSDALAEVLSLKGGAAMLAQVQVSMRATDKVEELLAKASLHLARLTRGSCTRIERDPQQETLVVLRREDDDKPLQTRELSEGTCDQLWLALRLGLIEPHLSVKRLPLILDDVLIQFDDARAQAALETLAEVARHTQVILFTHHAHLLSLAREAGLAFHEQALPSPAFVTGTAQPLVPIEAGTPRPRAAPRRETSPRAPLPAADPSMLSDDARAIVAMLEGQPERKGGNGRLRELLGFDEPRYAQARDELLAARVVEKKPGRGGALQLVGGELLLPGFDAATGSGSAAGG